MNRSAHAVALAALAAAGSALGQPVQWQDAPDDAVMRRTDIVSAGFVQPTVMLPDLLTARLGGWVADDPVADPYSGRFTPDGVPADLLRLDVVFAGLVNPPGTLGLNGFAYDPYEFGDNPVYGFLELDIDDNIDTGGQIGSGAELRYLANVGRFGSVPIGPLSARTAKSADDYDASFDTAPQYERSGEDFSLVLCGCEDLTVVSRTGDQDVFAPGDTWIVRGRFFQRAAGYAGASRVYGGSDFGMYDPVVDLRFSHDIATDTTTISLVFPLTPLGASLLTGEPEQPIDNLIGYGSHFSVLEAVTDLVNTASGLNGPPPTGPVATLIEGWAGVDPESVLDPSRWRMQGLFGTAYAEQTGALYIWTDVGFDKSPGDVNGDGVVDQADNALIQQTIAALDGGPGDADGVANGVVVIPDQGLNFSLYDVDGNGKIDQSDLSAGLTTCRADWDLNSTVDVFDLLAFIQQWLRGSADFNGDGVSNITDLLGYLGAYFNGC